MKLIPFSSPLEDSERFAAAHVLLSTMWANRQWAGTPPIGPNRDPARGRVAAVFNGLRLELPSRDEDRYHWSPSIYQHAVYFGPAVGYDPSQVPALRNSWFDRLAVPVRSVRYGVLMTAAATPALPWLALRARRLYLRRRRRRLGLCLRCGYDLRGNTSGVCSECGRSIEAVRAGGRAKA